LTILRQIRLRNRLEMRASAGAWTMTGVETDQDWPQLALAFAIAFLMTGLPILLHLVGQPVALLYCVAAAVLAARLREQDVPIIVLTANIFQNIFAALVSSNFTEYSDIEVLKSYSFLTTIVSWLVVTIGFLKNSYAYSPFVRRLILASFGLLAIVGIYFVAGLALNPRNATVYLRNIGLPILMFQTFLLVASKHKTPLPKIVFVLLGLVTICGYLELFALDFWLTVTNGWNYFTLFTAKRLLNVNEIRTSMEAGQVITSVLDYTKSDLLNTALLSGLGFKVQRLQGPNFNTISLGYLLAIFIAFSAVHRHWLIALLAVPLLIATSAKGPMVLAIACVVFHMLARRRNPYFAIKALLVGLSAYALFVFQAGLSVGDYHVLGLLGGVNGFLKWPIGHTLGDGGNLSISDFSTLDWGKFQRAGAVDTAVESAVGVLLYQLGLAAGAVFLFYLWIASIAWRLYRATRAPALAYVACAILVCLVNGLFQEDAYFVPLSLAFVMGFAGLSLGATDRAVVARLSGERGGAGVGNGFAGEAFTRRAMRG
jgi:hypothetical protein